MNSDQLLRSPEFQRLATDHVVLLLRQLTEGCSAVEDVLILRVEAALAQAARSCADVASLEVVYDASVHGPSLRLRSGAVCPIPLANISRPPPAAAQKPELYLGCSHG